jgi:hypothetical protein
VEGLRRSGIEFLETPATYYDMLPERLVRQKVTNFDENVDELKRLGILVDGDDDRYLLQIFMVEGGLLYDDDQAGPFFYEVIQRRARGASARATSAPSSRPSSATRWVGGRPSSSSRPARGADAPGFAAPARGRSNRCVVRRLRRRRLDRLRHGVEGRSGRGHAHGNAGRVGPVGSTSGTAPADSVHAAWARSPWRRHALVG